MTGVHAVVEDELFLQMDHGPRLRARNEGDTIHQSVHQLDASPTLGGRIGSGGLPVEAVTGVLDRDHAVTGLEGEVDLVLLAPSRVTQGVGASFGQRHLDVTAAIRRHSDLAQRLAAEVAHEGDAELVARQLQPQADLHSWPASFA